MIKKFNKSKVLIIGATGFVGSWLCLYLKKTNHNYLGIGLDEKKNLFHKKIKNKINFKYLDITNQNNLFKELDKFKPDIIINLAAYSLVHFCNIYPHIAVKNNTLSTLNILEYIRKNNHILLINFTSDKVYKNQIKSHNETSEYGSSTIYGTTKVLSDLLASNYKNLYKLNILNVRCGNLYGGGDFNPNRFFSDIFKSYSLNKKLRVRSMKSTRPWTYVLELLNFMIIITQKTYEKKIKLDYDGVNFSSKYKNYSIEDILKNIKNYMKLEWVSEKNYVSEDLHLKINSTYIRNKIKYSNKFKFKETLKDTVDWYKTFYSNGDIFKKSVFQISKIL